MRKVTRAVLKVLVFAAAASLVGRLVARAYEGDRSPDDDDFKLIAFWDGRKLTSEAGSLRTGTAVAAMGGIDIDLRGATLDSGGAHIALKAYMGGIRLVLPEGWKVYVDEDVRAGEIEVTTPAPGDVDDDAPRLTVEAVVRSGGILIATEE
ncbi:MAG: LiaF domain-containing protein [Acidimicrobiia bacterium]